MPTWQLQHPHPSQLAAVASFVQAAVRQTYPHLDLASLAANDAADWARSWVAVDGSKLCGVALTSNDSVDDLWVLPEAQGAGIGSRLLLACEQEIARHGFGRAHLRVVSSNRKALHFYQRRGWFATSETSHDLLPVIMVNMTKEIHR